MTRMPDYYQIYDELIDIEHELRMLKAETTLLQYKTTNIHRRIQALKVHTATRITAEVENNTEKTAAQGQ